MEKINENDFLFKFREQFEETEPSEICLDTNFHELDEWSSLTGLSIQALVDEEFDIQLSGDELQNVNTVRDLINLIEKKQINKL